MSYISDVSTRVEPAWFGDRKYPIQVQVAGKSKYFFISRRKRSWPSVHESSPLKTEKTPNLIDTRLFANRQNDHIRKMERFVRSWLGYKTFELHLSKYLFSTGSPQKIYWSSCSNASQTDKFNPSTAVHESYSRSLAHQNPRRLPSFEAEKGLFVLPHQRVSNQPEENKMAHD